MTRRCWLPVSGNPFSPSPSIRVTPSYLSLTLSGLDPGLVRLYQVNVQVPAGVPAGTQVVEIIINNVPSNTVTIAVQ